MSNGSQEKAAPQAVGEPDATAFRTLFDSAPALIWITDDKGQVTYANRRYEAVFGRPSGDMCGEGWKSILHPDDVDAFTTCFFDAFERREPFTADVRVRDRSGATVWLRCEGAPRFDGAGAFLGYTGCNIDVSEARLAEEARFAAEERSRLAAESADLGIWDWNPETGELRWDDRCRALFGLEPNTPVDDDVFLRTLHADDRPRVEAAVAAALEPHGGGLYQIEYRVLDAGNGAERWLSARGRALFEGGRAVRFIGAMLDITQRKRADAEKARLFEEAERELAERRRAEAHLQLLIHELNHRVKNTLATVQSIAIQSLRRASSPEAAHQAFTQRLIALSKAHDVLTAENWEGAFLHDVIRGAVDPFQNRNRDRFNISGPVVRLTPKSALALAMALHELGTNAVKYGALSNEDGRVDLGWSRLSGPQTPMLHLVWRERGGPPVSPPEGAGFGSRLIEHGLAGELNGEASIDYAPTGVICAISAPLLA